MFSRDASHPQTHMTQLFWAWLEQDDRLVWRPPPRSGRTYLRGPHMNTQSPTRQRLFLVSITAPLRRSWPVAFWYSSSSAAECSPALTCPGRHLQLLLPWDIPTKVFASIICLSQMMQKHSSRRFNHFLFTALWEQSAFIIFTLPLF